MKDEAAALFGAVRSLSASQRAKAKLGETFDDVLVGPQKDGQFPVRRGITLSSLSAAQQTIVTKAIRAYVGDMPTAQANARMSLYKSQYSRTRLAWSKSMDPQTVGAYVRIHGPRVWIEICVQNPVVLIRRPLPLHRARHRDGLWRWHVASRLLQPASCC